MSTQPGKEKVPNHTLYILRAREKNSRKQSLPVLVGETNTKNVTASCLGHE